MSIIQKLEKNKTVQKYGRKFRKYSFEKRKNRAVRGKYTFINRQKKQKKLCIILAGYKDIIWNDVESRLIKYIPKDVDVCLMTSGKYSEKLSSTAAKNKWSYLSTKENKVTLIQNIAISLFPNAELIYKLDEDIFITKDFFKNLETTYYEVENNNSLYDVGFVSCLLNVNGFSYITLLDEFGLRKDYEKKFGRARYICGCFDDAILKNGEAAKYMWGSSDDRLKDIDSLSATFEKKPLNYTVCAVRFSIGA